MMVRLRRDENAIPVLDIDEKQVLREAHARLRRASAATRTGALALAVVLALGGVAARALVPHGRAAEQGRLRGPDARVPSIPKNLIAEAVAPTQVELSWVASRDDDAIAGYRIYRDGAQVAEVDGDSLTYTDTGLKPDTTYQYAVEALDAEGNRSGRSDTVAVTTPDDRDGQAPTAPDGLRAAAVEPDEVVLTWLASEDDVGVAGYTVYRDRKAIATLDGLSLSYSDTTVEPETSYEYAVEAFDPSGNRSALSQSLSLTTPPPVDTQVPAAPTSPAPDTIG